MTIEICPKFQKCLIYNEQVHLFSQETLDIYKRNYCLAGREKFSQCKRFQVSEATGRPAPSWVLPNSLLSVEEIIRKMESDEQ